MVFFISMIKNKDYDYQMGLPGKLKRNSSFEILRLFIGHFAYFPSNTLSFPSYFATALSFLHFLTTFGRRQAMGMSPGLQN